MAKEIPTVEPPPLLVIRGTGPEPEPPPYRTNKPGIPPGANPDGTEEMANVEPPPLLVIRGTGPEPEPPPYYMNKPGIPPGEVPDELKEQMRRARMDLRARRGGDSRNGRTT